MKATASVLILVAAWGAPAPAPAEQRPAFPYDRTRTPRYLDEALHAPPTGRSLGLRRQLAAAVDEILDGPWLPLYSDYSAAQAGGVAPAEWCFNRPGEYVLVLSLAASYLDPRQKERAGEFLAKLLKTCAPTRKVCLPVVEGKPRTLRRSPAPREPGLSEPETQRLWFAEGYAIWAYASAFDAWAEARPLFDDLARLRGRLEARGDLAPAYLPECAGPLTAADAKDPEYRFRVYQSLLAGFQDNYGYRGAREARARMQKDKPVFFHVRLLSALVGHYRLARHFAQAGEARWARRTFDQIAAMTLEQKSAPYLWSDAGLTPEVGRLIRDGAGPWLDELASTPNVGNLPATDWSGRVVAGRRDYFVMNPYTWYHAWGGQGEGMRPGSVLGAFLANAYLLGAPPDRVAQTLDIPWCKADLYYARKLLVLIQASEEAQWRQGGIAGP